MRPTRRCHALPVSLLVPLLVLGAVSAVGAQPHLPGSAAPHSVVVPGRYIVVLRHDVPSAAAVSRDLSARHGIAVSHVYETALKGFAADVPAGRLLALQFDPRVAFVEPDQTAHTFAQEIPTGVLRIFARTNADVGTVGSDARVDVDVAVIDTGIADHPDLDVVKWTDCSGGGPFKQSCADDKGSDGNGHGTHVAGTIAALDNGIGVVGVAPGARLWSVKVLGDNGSGYISWIIAGIDWVTRHADRIAVANMSLGCECTSSAMDQAIARSVDAGVVYVVAAGNSAKDAATFSPANHPDVITVSALADFDGEPGGHGAPTCRQDTDDTLANFSNFGKAVDVAAPGVCIVSTWRDGGYRTISGTSMAAPHVAGAAAILASAGKPADRDAVLSLRSKMIKAGNLEWEDTSLDGIHEPLLDVGDADTFTAVLVAGQDATAEEGNDEQIAQEPSGTPTMGVFTITPSGARHLDLVVNIRADSNDDGTLTSGGDGPVSGAGVTLQVIRQVNGTFTCNGSDNCWTFAGNTDGSGNFKAKLLHAPSGSYRTEVTGLVGGGHQWDPALDGENPRHFSR